MSISILFVHGGGEGAYAEDTKLVESLRTTLGDGYEVVYPQMPNEDSPDYDEWKRTILKTIAGFAGKAIVVGHSFGASILLKVLAEAAIDKPLVGIFLIAMPYWGAQDWEADVYALQDEFVTHLPQDTPIFLYHSRDDDIVPFAHLAMYAQKLPQATTREFDGRGHQFNNDLSEVAASIKSLV